MEKIPENRGSHKRIEYKSSILRSGLSYLQVFLMKKIPKKRESYRRIE